MSFLFSSLLFFSIIFFLFSTPHFHRTRFYFHLISSLLLSSHISFPPYRYPSDFSSRRYGSTNTPTPYTAQNAGHGVNGTMTSSSGMNITGNTANTAAPINGPPPTPIDCLKVLVHYLRREEKEKVLHLLFESSPPAVKYKKFTYRCRTLISEKDYFKKAAPSWNHTGHDGSHGSHGTSSEEKEPVSI